jgi:predicted phage gp36 major capsid-like protein
MQAEAGLHHREAMGTQQKQHNEAMAAQQRQHDEMMAAQEKRSAEALKNSKHERYQAFLQDISSRTQRGKIVSEAEKLQVLSIARALDKSWIEKELAGDRDQNYVRHAGNVCKVTDAYSSFLLR